MLEEAFSAVEQEKDVVVATSVRSFMQSLVEESVMLRRSEWSEVTGLNLEDRPQLEAAFYRAAQSVYEVLRDAPVDELDERGYVSIIGTVETIHNEWCEVFPICRYRPQESAG